MRAHRSLSALLAMTLGFALLPLPAEAQGLLDRLKRAATQVATEEVMQQADALLGDLSTRVVEDGRFMAVATPWASQDGTERVNRATISGAAFVQRSGGGFGLVLCDDAQPQQLVAGFTSSATAASLAQQAGEPVPAAGAGEAPASPLVGVYPLSSNQVRGAAGGAHVRPQTEAEGSLRLTSVAEDLWIGTATLNLPQTRVAQEAEPHAVQVAVAFRARPGTAANMPANCRMPGQ